MVRKLRIGIDIDDTLINTVDTVTTLGNEQYGTVLTRDDWFNVTPEAIARWGMKTGSEVSDRVHELMTHEDYIERVVGIKGAKEVLDHLTTEGHELFAVTSRPDYIRDQTIQELEQCFPGLFSDKTLFMINAFSADPAVARATKFGVAEQLGLTHFIDDLLIHANAVSDGGIKTILFSDNYLWNQGPEHEGVIRLGSWKDIGAYLDGEANR
ncbi:MAG: hypothetical protein JWO99_20 [Candidatus Saccharibacteria bacterium]|nr:hypothetical protein [Candidatus Saccharibacteria bacterium]